MKKIITSFALSFALLNVHSQETEKGIVFSSASFNELLAKAKTENKLIFLDAYAVWCGPCKWMAKNIFTNDTAATYYNANFICTKIDMEKGEGPALARRFAVTAYPTMLYINGNGDVIHRFCGTRNTTDFVQEGENAISSTESMHALRKKFEQSPVDYIMANKYLNVLSRGCASTSEALTLYFKNQKESDLISRANWQMIYNYLSDANTREFDYLLKNSAAFEKLYTADSVQQKTEQVFTSSIKTYTRLNDTAAISALNKKLAAAGKAGEKVKLSMQLNEYKQKQQWTEYAAVADAYVEKFAYNNANELNSIAWTFYEKISDSSYLQKAIRWSKRSTELNNNYAFNDTYAALLYKAGKKDEAIKAAEKAIELAKKTGEDYKETEDLLIKIKGK